MATGTILLPLKAGTSPDGSTNNAAADVRGWKGTGSDPKAFGSIAWFDPSTAEYLWWTDIDMPDDYASGLIWRGIWIANATTGSVVWQSSIGAITPGSDAVTYLAKNNAATTSVTTATDSTANELNVSSITYANLDSLAAGDNLRIVVARDAGNGSDTLSVDAGLLTCKLSYTTT